MPKAFAAIIMGVGMACVLRATAIVATGTRGRFRGDPWASMLAGFALILTGLIALP